MFVTIIDIIDVINPGSVSPSVASAVYSELESVVPGVVVAG